VSVCVCMCVFVCPPTCLCIIHCIYGLYTGSGLVVCVASSPSWKCFRLSSAMAPFGFHTERCLLNNHSGAFARRAHLYHMNHTQPGASLSHFRLDIRPVWNKKSKMPRTALHCTARAPSQPANRCVTSEGKPRHRHRSHFSPFTAPVSQKIDNRRINVEHFIFCKYIYIYIYIYTSFKV